MMNSQWLRNSRGIRWLFHNIFVTGDNVRLCVQRSLIRDMLPSRVRRALDAGSGSGEYTRSLLLPRADQVVAMDNDGDALGRLESRLSSWQRRKCHLVNGSVHQIPLPDSYFDLVLCTEVLEHCPDDEAVLKELARVLAPGASLIISVPVPPAPLPDPAHVREGYHPDALCARLAEHGIYCQEQRLCIFYLSQVAIRMAAWFKRWLKVAPPLMILCHLEQQLQLVGATLGTAYDVVICAERESQQASSPLAVLNQPQTGT